MYKQNFASVQKSEHWSLKKWGLLIVLVFFLQLLFFACFLKQGTTGLSEKRNPSQVIITDLNTETNSDLLSPYIKALDPFLFSYGSKNGVTSSIWKTAPKIEYDMAFLSPLSSTIAPDEFYFLNDVNMLLTSSQNGRNEHTRHIAISDEKIQEPEGHLSKPENSEVQLFENVKPFFRIPKTTLPIISYNGVLQDTKIVATIGADGRILSVVLASSCGLSRVDTLALEIAQGLRLLPIDPELLDSTDEKQNFWENFKIAGMFFHWRTTPLK